MAVRTTTFEEAVDAAEWFQKQAAKVTPNHNLDFVINTDQTGCEYGINIRGALSRIGEKRREVGVRDINKITHSCTAQCAVTALGKLLHAVFVCLQERSGAIGPVSFEEVKTSNLEMFS